MEDDVLAYVAKHATAGDPQSALDAFDQFSTSEAKVSMIHVGAKKGLVLDDAVRRVLQSAPYDADKGYVLLEMGTNCGYSAARIARLLKESNQKAVLYTFDVDQRLQGIAKKFIDFAGLSKYVRFVLGSVNEKLEATMHSDGNKKVDFVFIDHIKTGYVPDFKLVERLNLFRKGSIVVADNILWPGVPDYLTFLQQHPMFQSQLTRVQLRGIEDALLISEYSA